MLSFCILILLIVIASFATVFYISEDELLDLLVIERWKLVYETFHNIGISGPSPQLYYGNAKEIRKKGILKFLEENVLIFGQVFGYFNGTRSYIVVTDLEMIKQIGVRQFDIFMDREPVFGLIRQSSNVRGLLNSRGENWRRRRKILSKSFNAINMNRMSPMIAASCNSLSNKLDELACTQQSHDMFKLYCLYTMEVILSTGFGHIINVIEGGADELTKACGSVFAFIREGSAGGLSGIKTLLTNFPFMEWFVRRMVVQSKAGQEYLIVERMVKELVERRLQDNKDKNVQDLLQLLINARADDDDIDIQHKQLSDLEIVRTALSLLLAGYETTSNALAFTTYLLATHPEEQEKVYHEISQYYQDHPTATLNEVSQNVLYLDMIIQESLRLYPPAPRFNRYCSKTVTISGVTIPKGCVVEIPSILIHHSPEHWSEPQLFKPSRFTKEEKEKRHALAHIPFGLGPRSCIGMRLALMEAKMALVSILYNYKLIESPDTQKPLAVDVGLTMVPRNGVYIRIKRR